jgi:hypothetical protein
MGNVTKLYKKKQLEKKSDIFTNTFNIERCEGFHIHWRNLRMLFNQEEFETFCQGVMEAYKKWEEAGKPPPEPDKDAPEYLLQKTINPIHGLRPTDYAIEFIASTPYQPEMIHIHYRSLRLDLSQKELEQLK